MIWIKISQSKMPMIFPIGAAQSRSGCSQIPTAQPVLQRRKQSGGHLQLQHTTQLLIYADQMITITNHIMQLCTISINYYVMLITWMNSFAVPSKLDASKNTCKIVVMRKISVKFQLITCKRDIKCLENYINIIWFFEWKWSADHNHAADHEMWFKNQKSQSF